MMTPELFTDLSEVGPIEDDWRALAELRGNAFLTPEWFRSWTEGAPGMTVPFIVAARRSDGSLAGVMPLVLDAARRPRVMRFAGARYGDHFAPVCAEEDESEVASVAMSALQRKRMDRYMLMLNRVDITHSWWRDLRQAATTARAELIQQRAELPLIRFDGLDWEGFLESRSSNFRQQVRRRNRKLEQAGDVVVRAATDESLESDLDRFFRLHELRWAGGSSLNAKWPQRALASFAAAAQRRGWLRLRFLEIDGAPTAAFLGWRIGGTYTFYQSGFDPKWSGLSVGTVLMNRTIQSALEEGASEFDLLLGNEPYKKRLQNASRQVHTVVLTKPMSPSRLLLAVESIARRGGSRLAGRKSLAATSQLLRRLLPTSRG